MFLLPVHASNKSLRNRQGLAASFMGLFSGVPAMRLRCLLAQLLGLLERPLRRLVRFVGVVASADRGERGLLGGYDLCLEVALPLPQLINFLLQVRKS